MQVNGVMVVPVREIVIAVVLMATICCGGCANHRPFNQAETDNVVKKAMEEVRKNQEARQEREARARELESRQAHEVLLPRFKKLTPLDTQKISISFLDEDFQAILQLLARSGGYNLIIDGQAAETLGQHHRLSAEFHERSIREVLNYVCTALDLAWQERGGTIYVTAMERKIFSLDFLNHVQQARFSVGGDVLGGTADSGGSSGSGQGEENVLAPLSGNYEISGGSSDEGSDIYEEIEEAVSSYVGEQGKYYLNRATGTLVVVSRPHIVKEVGEFLDSVKEKYRRQVLIEAKIVEVVLNRNHEVGIDWKKLELSMQNYERAGVQGSSFAVAPALLNDGSSWFGLTLSSRFYDLGMVLHALEEFGSINTLSNPRLKVMNGQPAMISVGQSVSYLRSLEYETTDTANTTYREPSVDIGTLFDGVLLGVTPEIQKNDWVNLHLVPIKSDIVSVEEREYGENRYAFPVVNLREVSTMVRARSGDLIILGGLIHDKVRRGDSGVPGLNNLPGLGPLFKYSKDQRVRVELVIILNIRVMHRGAGNEQAV